VADSSKFKISLGRHGETCPSSLLLSSWKPATDLLLGNQVASLVVDIYYETHIGNCKISSLTRKMLASVIGTTVESSKARA